MRVDLKLSIFYLKGVNDSSECLRVCVEIFPYFITHSSTSSSKASSRWAMCPLQEQTQSSVWKMRLIRAQEGLNGANVCVKSLLRDERV